MKDTYSRAEIVEAFRQASVRVPELRAEGYSQVEARSAALGFLEGHFGVAVVGQ